MSTVETTFVEAPHGSVPIRELGLTIAGTWLEEVLRDFDAELAKRGLTRVRPRYYLSTEWGVPFDTVALAIPFYLARQELMARHAERWGFVEGATRADILRYLRHEMGHVVNYAYHLYEDEDWIKHFGAITQPYVEEYRPEPFSRRYVQHLPGWYAQKHPDEDWAETFAVWLTPERDWREEYRQWPEALAKLEYCDRTMAALRDRDPIVSAEDLDEDVSELSFTVDQFYRGQTPASLELPHGFDGALRAIFDDYQAEATGTKPASALIRQVSQDVVMNVYRWTGHFPERTQVLLQHLAERANQLRQVYPERRETTMAVALTALVTALAMNHVQHGRYEA